MTNPIEAKTELLVLDLKWFEAQVAPMIGAVKSITVSPERSHQIAAAYKSILGSASPSLAFLETALVVNRFMPDDMFIVVDSRGGVHPCKFGDSHNIGARA